MNKPVKLYRHPLSGHCHRVELFLSLLGLEYEPIDVDLAKGEHKAPAFLNKNIFGQVPVIDDDGIVIADSNAILVYLARRYDPHARWLPAEPVAAAEVQRFLSVAAGQIAAGPAAARLVNVFGAELDHAEAIRRSQELLHTLERHLAGRDFLDGGLSIADIAAYTYIAHAPEGGVSLQPYPEVRAWLRRVEALPGFVPMQKTAIGLAA
jgi:glutathione S-transferase